MAVTATISKIILGEHLLMLTQSGELYAKLYPSLHWPQATPVLCELHWSSTSSGKL